jgi:prevent-host-death family protein
MATWQLQDAKNRLSEVLNTALGERPQTVTRHGRPVAVIASTAYFERRRGLRSRGTAVKFLRSLSFARGGLESSAEDELFLSALTVGELPRGIDKLPHGERKLGLLRDLTLLRGQFAGRLRRYGSRGRRVG